ncbi:hypothetical protein OS493_024726 [Desmophyllum pertusum]|uniref:Uncharacterized protein n=1 Tax=Desmophyllum pertusum TaxID=174260 RepID=A0A9W9ZBR5_9CNID|nr:hypothetical protein OS493_024726 [Desmophyllum pertusum]
MKSKTYGYIYREPLATLGGSGVLPTVPPERPITLKMEDATKTPPGAHSHEVTLIPDEVKLAKGRKRYFRKTTTPGAGHQHTITVFWRNGFWMIQRCDDYDDRQYRCKDRHGKYLIEDINV